MSEISTRSLPERDDSLGAFKAETPRGKVTVDVTGSPSNAARVDVELEDGPRWVFGVNDEIAVLVLKLNQQGQRVDSDLPRWIGPVVQRTGLEGVETA